MADRMMMSDLFRGDDGTLYVYLELEVPPSLAALLAAQVTGTDRDIRLRVERAIEVGIKVAAEEHPELQKASGEYDRIEVDFGEAEDRVVGFLSEAAKEYRP